MSYVASCSHTVTRERPQPAPKEKLMEKQNLYQKRTCLVALTLLLTIARFPRDHGDRLSHKMRRAAEERMPHSTNDACPLALLPKSKVVHSPKPLRIWTPVSRSCKANPMPVGSFSLLGSCWLEAWSPQASFTKPRVIQPDVCSFLPHRPGTGCWKMWGSVAISGS